MGADAKKYLKKIYKLIYPINSNIQILYFCQREQYFKWNDNIICIPFDDYESMAGLVQLISNYIVGLF